jgi:hypothetical protein
VPRQELVDPVDGMIRDVLQDVPQVTLGVEPVEAGGA